MMRTVLLSLLLLGSSAIAQEATLVEPGKDRLDTVVTEAGKQPQGAFAPIDVRDVSRDLDRKLEMRIDQPTAKPVAKDVLLVSVD